MRSGLKCALFFPRARVYISASVFAFILARAAFAEPAADPRVAISTNAAALSNSDSQVRGRAALELGRLRASGQAPALAAQFTQEKDPKVRKAIAISLSNLGAPASDGLLQALADPLADVRAEAVTGLGKLGTPAALAALRSRLAQEGNAGVRQGIVFWLGQLKDDASSDAIGGLLSDPNPNIRAQAAHALGWIGTDKAKGHLRRVTNERDPQVRQVIDANKL